MAHRQEDRTGASGAARRVERGERIVHAIEDAEITGIYIISVAASRLRVR